MQLFVTPLVAVAAVLAVLPVQPSTGVELRAAGGAHDGRSNSSSSSSLRHAEQRSGIKLRRFAAPLGIGSGSTGGNSTRPTASLLSGRRQPQPPSWFHNPMSGAQLGGGMAPGAGPGAGGEALGCHPRCWWTCGTANCDESCDPVCSPPQCQTACGPINVATCRQQCEPPRCAIVCPSNHCEHGDCPTCKTVCAPPRCATKCSENCESKCAEPQCSWKCTPGKCDKPKCSLTCGGAKMCNFEKDVATKPKFDPGMTTISANSAAFDPKVLGVAGAPMAGAPAPGPAGAGPVVAFAPAPPLLR